MSATPAHIMTARCTNCGCIFGEGPTECIRNGSIVFIDGHDYEIHFEVA